MQRLIMLIINGVWYANPTRSNIEASPTSAKFEIMGDYHSGPKIYSPSCNMPSTIHFVSQVFKHDGDFNLKWIGINGSDLTHVGCEVFSS
jgi:hypothetical protein